ncbi:helix-turn-helix domain-containing protein [Rhizobium sp. L1K21]|uniref:winged helix-turn-helix transcriptional regulator n=1 Tax=Rhizobium sp. L1K21 TaxID=2954933 RepID=UPI00209373A6|nr:helix-turn-helix domain-containing protein [Rhizobium sp. L1K21]MCO6184950.1 helix-turn-helix transcriptional regulator [Rhizobium sp. L1K21]
MCSAYDHNKCTTVSEILARLGDKWTILIIMQLGESPLRFSELKRAVVGISQRMLTLTLRALERDGIVKRTVYPTVPPRVEYSLTELGISFSQPVKGIGSWVFQNHAEIHAARADFDLRNGEVEDSKLIRIS